jgi:tetratricopeptide (TPR) repeat protein
LLLGVGSRTDTKTAKLYSTTILNTTLALHREAFYTTGNFGIASVNTMLSEIGDLIKQEGAKRELLEIYTEYSTLGILIGREELNKTTTEKYITTALATARSLHNTILLARALSAASDAMREFGDLSQAEAYSLEAEKLTKMPHHLRALIHIGTALATEDIQAIEKAQKLVVRDNDFPQVNLDLGYCYLYGASVSLDTGQYNEALMYLDAAEEELSAKFMRRQCFLQTLQAQYYLGIREYENARHIAETAIGMARSIKSKPNIERLRGIAATIKRKSSPRKEGLS